MHINYFLDFLASETVAVFAEVVCYQSRVRFPSCSQAHDSSSGAIFTSHIVSLSEATAAIMILWLFRNVPTLRIPKDDLRRTAILGDRSYSADSSRFRHLAHVLAIVSPDEQVKTRFG
jgi:hypothetical protein